VITTDPLPGRILAWPEDLRNETGPIDGTVVSTAQAGECYVRVGDGRLIVRVAVDAPYDRDALPGAQLSLTCG